MECFDLKGSFYIALFHQLSLQHRRYLISWSPTCGLLVLFSGQLGSQSASSSLSFYPIARSLLFLLVLAEFWVCNEIFVHFELICVQGKRGRSSFCCFMCMYSVSPTSFAKHAVWPLFLRSKLLEIMITNKSVRILIFWKSELDDRVNDLFEA